jgi:hypothetical protein
VEKDDLQAGNAIFMGTSQLSVFVGPIIAGGVIAFFAGASAGITGAGMLGIAVALTVDALTFAVSVVTLLMMRLPPAPVQQPAVTAGSVMQSIRDGLSYVWRTPLLRDLFILITVLNFLFSGPVGVGIAVIANQRLAEGAVAFGIIMAGYGAGNLAGIIGAGALPKPKPQTLGYIMLGVFALFGLGEILIGYTSSMIMGFLILLVLGLFNGYISILAITLLQKMVPQDMTGRIMSLVMLANVGLAPISQALAGALIKVSIEGMFAGAGLIVLASAILAILSPSIRNIGILTDS